MYANLKLQYMECNIKIYKAMIQWSMLFSTIAFCYECCKPRRKKGEREATLNQGESPSFPDTCHVCCREHLHWRCTSMMSMITHQYLISNHMHLLCLSLHRLIWPSGNLWNQRLMIWTRMRMLIYSLVFNLMTLQGR